MIEYKKSLKSLYLEFDFGLFFLTTVYCLLTTDH
jgi:hypothetical protein